jgi:hypothetical protein
MANTKITSLTALTSGSVASGDLIPIVDVSDTTQAATGTTKKLDASSIFFKDVSGTVSAATTYSSSATFSGTVTASGTFRATGTNPSFTNSVGFGTTTPSARIHTFTSADEHLRLEHSSPTGSPYVSFYQSGTRRAFVQFNSTNNTIFFASEYGDLAFKAASTAGSDTDTEYMRIKAGGTVDVQTVLQCDGLRIDQSPTAGAVTLTHYITVNLNGTTYRIPCGNA